MLYWRFTFPPNRLDIPRWAIRQGDWKLLSDSHDPDARPGDRTLKLIDLATDPQEATDLSSRHPEKVKELDAAWKKWSAELVNPAPTPADPRDAPRTKANGSSHEELDDVRRVQRRVRRTSPCVR